MAVGRGSTVEALHFAKQWDNETPEVVRLHQGDCGHRARRVAGVGRRARLRAESRVRIRRPVARRDHPRPDQQPPATCPFNVRFTEQTAGSTVNWVGEGAVKPVGELAFAEHTLTWSKVAGHRRDDRGARAAVDAIGRGSASGATSSKRISKFIDVQFVTPGVTATANNPASITNGASTSAASGTTAAALRDDLNTALASFSAANISTGTLHIITTEAVARGIALQVNALGQPEFATATPQGGTLFGYPVIAQQQRAVRARDLPRGE